MGIDGFLQKNYKNIATKNQRIYQNNYAVEVSQVTIRNSLYFGPPNGTY